MHVDADERFRFVSLFPPKMGQQLCVWYVMIVPDVNIGTVGFFFSCISIESNEHLKKWPETGF